MYNYCVDQCLGTGISKSWAIKHFQLLLDNLKDNEEVYCVFIGLHNYKSMTQHNNNYAYAMTNKRVIMAQHKMLGANVQSVNIENINDISLAKSGIAGIGIGRVCIDTFKETLNVGVNISFAENIYNCAHDVWDKIREQKNNGLEGENIQKYAAEQIKEFKELLDMGAITKEEFDAKKKQLLGL